MRRSVLILFLALASCGSAPVSPLQRADDLPRQTATYGAETFTPAPGERYAYRLLTHCGITQASFGGAWWVADPSLGDGSGNPPGEWENPFESGTMELRADDTLLFRGGRGRTARFVRAPAGFEPAMCD